MKTILPFLGCIFLLISSCTDDDTVAVQVQEEIERGAILRTLAYNNSTFRVGNASDVFSINLEEQDIKDGGLLESVDVYVRFLDNTSENGSNSSSEVKLKTLLASDFVEGPLELPRATLEFSFAQVLEATGIGLDQVICKDQFLVRLDLKLTDGRNFTEGDGSSWIIGLGSSSSSPYNYTIHVVEPIDDALFVGTYVFENLDSPPLGETFLTNRTRTVELTVGHSPNVRYFEAYHASAHVLAEAPKFFEFTVVCDETIFSKNQFTSFEGYCTFNSPPILLGPGSINGAVDPNDDSVFELTVREGYLGFDGGCGFGSFDGRIRFSKQ